MIETREHKVFYGYIVVLLSFVIMAVTWGIFYTYGIFFKPMSIEFAWSRATTSGAFSLAFILGGFLGIIAGRMSDRFGPRIVITISGLALGSGYLLMSQVNAAWQLYLFYALIGAGLGGGYVPTISAIARWFSKRRGAMTGIAMSGISVGIMVAPPVSNWLIDDYGWRISYIAIGAVVVIAMLLSAQFLKRDPDKLGLTSYGNNPDDLETVNPEGSVYSLKSAIYTRQFWLLCLMFSSLEFSADSIMVHIAPHITDLSFSAGSAAAVLAVIGGANIIGRVLMGNVSDKIGSRHTFIVCAGALLIALLWLLFAREMWAFYPFAIVFGFAFGGYGALISLLAADLFGLKSLGVILGSINFTITIGAAIGPAVAGLIFDISGSYQPAFLACTALSLISIISALLLKPIGR
ncbi:MFS transporter [Chloroflexota bacterium]